MTCSKNWGSRAKSPNLFLKLKIYTPCPDKKKTWWGLSTKIRPGTWSLKWEGSRYRNYTKCHQPYLKLITKEKMIILQDRNMADSTLTKWSKFTSPVKAQTNMRCLLIWWTQRNTTSLPKVHTLDLIMKKHQTNPNWVTLYKVIAMATGIERK